MHLTPVTKRDMAWEWARAEFKSARFGSLYAPYLTPSMIGALIGGDRSRLSDSEWTLLEQLVSGVRGPLLAGLLRLGAIWHAGIIAPDDLVHLRIVWPPLRAHSPSARLGELVPALDRGETLPQEPTFAPNYHALRAVFDVSRMQGAPILVTTRAEGPFGIVEGYSRCSVLLSKYMEGAALPRIPVVVGVCRRLPEWHLNDDPANVSLYWD